jgi:asparagine synthase (glutamine-hydrolysing)
MCGVAGIIGDWRRENHGEWLDLMKSAMVHRGSDDHGTHVVDNCTLGHQRLSIIDTGVSGHQPMISNDQKVVIVFNGEIYNFIELKQLLKSEYDFKTHSDTEVIIAAYQRWGRDFVKYLNGMFAIAIYDQEKHELLMVRDRLGEKPLYWIEHENTLFFSSEIRSLLSAQVIDPVVDETALMQYVTYQTVWNPRTIVKDVFSFLPGEMKIWSGGKFTESFQYWSPQELESAQEKDSRELVQKIVRGHLERSVEWRMRSDVPFGAFLSGGVDSSVIVGLMAQYSHHAVSTFSIGFEEKQFDESEYAQLIAKKYNTDHHTIVLRANDFLSGIIPALDAMDHPSGDGVNSYVVAKVTREQGVKMALSGLGGDEVFGGYPIFGRLKNSDFWRSKMPSVAVHSRVLKSLLSMKWNAVQVNRMMNFLGSTSKDDFAMYKADRTLTDLQAMQEFSEEQFAEIFPLSAWRDKGKGQLYQSISAAEMSSYMSHVLLRDGDQMSMAHTLEVRVPFLDHELIEYVLGLSDELKIGSWDKNLLIQSCSDLLPREIYDRKKKGFTFPWESWMRGPLVSFCSDALSDIFDIPIFSTLELEEQWNRFLLGDKKVPWNYFWHLVVLSHWLKKNNVRFS